MSFFNFIATIYYRLNSTTQGRNFRLRGPQMDVEKSILILNVMSALIGNECNCTWYARSKIRGIQCNGSAM